MLFKIIRSVIDSWSKKKNVIFWIKSKAEPLLISDKHVLINYRWDKLTKLSRSCHF